MAFISELDVINEMLASLGESPVNVIDADHPLTAAGVRMLRVANLREQTKSWWFNKEQVTLTPDATSGYIYTPEDAIRVDPTDSTLNYVQRGRRLYQSYAPNSTNKYVFTLPVTCWLVRLVPFEDVPPSAQVLISYAAQLDFQKAYDADRLKFEQIKLEYSQALISLNAEHIRNSEVNLFRRDSTARTLNSIASGTRGRY
jgi:hypothetical protein